MTDDQYDQQSTSPQGGAQSPESPAQSPQSPAESTPQSQPQPQPAPQPRPLPGQHFIRPGIDDRPDYEKALSPEDKAAVARLAVPLRRRAPEAAAAQPETQAARLSAAGSPATAASAVDAAIPDMSSAFLDMRDPMVSADGQRPDAAQVRRLTWGFGLAAALRTIPWVMLNMVLLPAVVDRLAGNGYFDDFAAFCHNGEADGMLGVSSVIPLAAIIAIGCVVALFANAVVAVVSDRTRTAIGRRTPWILAGGALCALGTLMLGAIEGISGALLLWIVLNIGYAMVATPFAAAFAERMPDKFRERSMRWRGVGLMIGQAAGVWFAAFGVIVVDGRIVGGFGELPFAVCAVMFLLCAIIPLLVWPRERSSQADARQPFDLGSVHAQFRMPQDAPRFRMAFAARLCMMTGAGFVSVFLWLIVRHGVADAVQCRTMSSFPATIPTGLMLALMALATLAGSALASLVAGRIADRVEDARRVAVPACVLYGVLMLVPVVAPNMTGLAVFALVSGFAFGLYDVFNQTLVLATLPDPRTSGRDLGMFNVANVIAPANAAVIGACVAVAFGYFALFVAALVFVLVSALLMVCAR